jgi:hypothetical protein
MRILLDECVPVQVRYALVGQDVSTAQPMGVRTREMVEENPHRDWVDQPGNLTRSVMLERVFAACPKVLGEVSIPA